MQHDSFTPLDWVLLAVPALSWGSSFLLMEIGLRDLDPSIVTLGRLLLGAAALALMPRSYRSVARQDWGKVALLGVMWMGIPFLLFPVAQQWISSSLAGMLNGGVPLWTALFTVLFTRMLPPRQRVVGLIVGFVGIVIVSLPSLGQGSSNALGAGLVVVATVLYGLSLNIAGPLQRTYGALPVIFRAELVAIAFVLPFTVDGFAQSTFTFEAGAAIAALGVFSSGIALVSMATLAGRVGADRSSVTIYFPPLIAIVLGVLFLGESVHPAALAGVALVLAGAWITSRREGPAPAAVASVAVDGVGKADGLDGFGDVVDAQAGCA